MYVLAFDTGIGFGLSWYWLMGSLTRITTTQRVAVGGYYWGTFLPSCAAIFIGMWTGYAIGETDPTKWMVDLAGPVLGIIALIFIIFANISSGAVMIYTGVVALRQFKWARRWSWSMLVFLVALPALLTMLAQDTIYTRMGMVMAVWNILFIPMAVTVFLDYHVFRKQHLDLKALYDTSPSGPYYFWKGWNPAFLVTLALGALFYLTLNDPIHLDPHWYFKYASASLPTYAFCCILYYALTKYWIIPKGWGGYPELPKERASRAAEVARLQRTI
jgi:NCS1 family nucleobase:cation symporter-1